MAVLFLLLSLQAFAGVGESAVITLIFPYGARSCGMGEVGTALADDESALFFNPAGLDIRNARWQWGSASNFREPLLPALHIDDLWHYAFTGYVQPSTRNNIGGFGVYYNVIDMGENVITDAIGRPRRSTHSWEGVMALGWGFNLAELGDSSRHYGIAIKPFVSALAPGIGENGEGTARGFAIDIGLLRVFRNGLRFGFTMMNMGPNVFYICRSQADPLPFTINCALAYKRSFYQDNIRLVDIAGEVRLNKELVINHYNGDPEPFYKAMFKDLFNEPLSYEIQEINYHAGIEVGILNTVFYRQGFLFDYIGERYEMTMGGGIRLFRHMDADFSIIYSPEGFLKPLLRDMDDEKDGATGVRHLQWRLNFAFTGIGKFKKRDLAWWEE
jgi:hypothetical protein